MDIPFCSSAAPYYSQGQHGQALGIRSNVILRSLKALPKEEGRPGPSDRAVGTTLPNGPVNK
jgi:hypothetical protein